MAVVHVYNMVVIIEVVMCSMGLLGVVKVFIVVLFELLHLLIGERSCLVVLIGL